MAVLHEILGRMDLLLNETKTRVADARQEMFSFLGFEIGIWGRNGANKGYPHVQPSRKSIQTIKNRITKMTARERAPIPLDRLVSEVNRSVRGWVGYFYFRNCSKKLLQVRTHLEERMRTHLRKRHKIRDRKSGYMRFPRRDLYEDFTKCRLQRPGSRRMPCGEGHRKAVCEKIA